MVGFVRYIPPLNKTSSSARVTLVSCTPVFFFNTRPTVSLLSCLHPRFGFSSFLADASRIPGTPNSLEDGAPLYVSFEALSFNRKENISWIPSFFGHSFDDSLCHDWLERDGKGSAYPFKVRAMILARTTAKNVGTFWDIRYLRGRMDCCQRRLPYLEYLQSTVYVATSPQNAASTPPSLPVHVVYPELRRAEGDFLSGRKVPSSNDCPLSKEKVYVVRL